MKPYHMPILFLMIGCFFVGACSGGDQDTIPQLPADPNVSGQGTLTLNGGTPLQMVLMSVNVS